MSPQSATIRLMNSRKAPHVFCVEPWGEDYTLLPGEEMEIVASGERAVPWFSLQERDDFTLVYCENAGEFKVMQGDRKLECGHQRQA